MQTFIEIFEGCADWVHANAPGATANQYLLDTGEDARRGFTYGGVHLWEHVKSTGMQHFVHDMAPVRCGEKHANGLYKGDSYLPYDELKAATLDKDKILYHWGLPQGTATERLKEVDWKVPVYVIRDEHANAVLFYQNNAVLLGEHIPEESGFITVFHFGSCMPALIPAIRKAKLLDIVWVSDKQAVLAFDTGKIGGAISCWYPDGNAEHPREENIQIHLGGEVFSYHRLNNQIIKKKGRKKMEFKNLPNLKEMTEEKAKEKKASEPKKEEDVKPAVQYVPTPTNINPAAPPQSETTEQAVPETDETAAKATDEQPQEQREEHTVEECLEKICRESAEVKAFMSELYKNLKLVQKAYSKMKKESANSDEVKSLKAENKELQKQLKDSEKRCSQLQAAVKTQAELLQKTL